MGSNEAGFSSKDSDVMKEKARSESKEFGHGIKSSLGGPADEKGGHNDYVKREALNKDQHQVHFSSLEELEKLVLEIKAEVKQKEEENVALSQQIQQYEKKWSLCEEKMKSMEEMYKKQIETLTVRPITQFSKCRGVLFVLLSSLHMILDFKWSIRVLLIVFVMHKQMNIAAVEKSLAANGTNKQPGNFDTSYGHGHDSKGAIPADARTPDGTPPKHLTKEFEQQKQVFQEDARVPTEVKSGRSGSVAKSIEELRKLKVAYAAWKKDYKARLHDTKAALRKLKKLEGEKPRRRWWGKKKKKHDK
ncbi:myosin-J heavy chain-like [Musa troglodytarum]|nr:myosin-J heavy chain-like [Musa troglodytarum]